MTYAHLFNPQLVQYWCIIAGLLLLIIVLECLPAAHRTVQRLRFLELALSLLKLVALVSAILMIANLPNSGHRHLLLDCLIFCGFLTLAREMWHRQHSGDRSLSSWLGGITVAIQLLCLILLTASFAGMLLTLLFLPISLLRSSLPKGLVIAWVEHFSDLVWLATLYYVFFCLARWISGGHGFSWLDPANWRTILPHLKFTIAFHKGYSAMSHLANNLRMAYVRSIIADDVEADLIKAIERAAQISPPHLPNRPLAFAIIGDPGEGDGSQISPWQREPNLAQQARQAIELVATSTPDWHDNPVDEEWLEFMILSSDVVYPAGELMDYERALYRPYHGKHPDADIPMYAIPGNHDWYDSLKGFFLNFTYPAAHEKRTPWGEALRHGPWAHYNWPWSPFYWSEVRRLREWYGLSKIGGIPGNPASQQRLPFFELAFDTVPLTVLGVDTGCTGVVDVLQHEWLRQRLRYARERGNLLFVILSEPLYVNGAFTYSRGLRDLYQLLRQYQVDIVMGGDTHAYQHYEVRYRTSNGGFHTAHHIVNGGGGAYLARPLDLSWQLKVTSGLLDQRFAYHDPAVCDSDEVTLLDFFPTANHLLGKFNGQVEGSRVRRWITRYETWCLSKGLTSALDHDRLPLFQSYITAHMEQQHRNGQTHWELRLTPWYTQPSSRTLLPQPPIRLRANAQDEIEQTEIREDTIQINRE